MSSRRGRSRGSGESPTLKIAPPIGRKLPEKRSFSDVGDLVTGRIVDILAPPVGSGQPINEGSALGVAAVVACVRIYSDMVAKLPIYLYRKTEKGPVEVTDHPAIRLLSGIPSQLHTSYELRNLMQTGVGLGGNGYARVIRDAFGEIRSIEWVPPCEVHPEMLIRPNGERMVFYRVAYSKNWLSRRDIIHIRSFCTDGLKGRSPIQMLRESIGTSLAQTQAAGSLMRNGNKWPGFITMEGVTKKEALDQVRDEINNNLAGAMNAGRIPVIGGNMKFTQTNGMSFVDAQFVESRKMELHEVARHYGVPAFMVDSTATSTWGSGIEQQTLGFLNFSLDPYLQSWQQSLAMSLLTEAEIASGHYFQFDRDELANVALEARANFFQKMRQIGVFSPNDVRSELGYPLIAPEDGGDHYGLTAAASPPESELTPISEP